MRVLVAPYDPAWPEQFAGVAASLSAALVSIEHTIEHVGSTAVPGLAAKPVLDIDVIVAADDVDRAIAALAASGYASRGDLGIPGRYSLEAPDDDPRRHVYVCEAGCLSVRNHLAVRDTLRAKPELRDAYAAAKLDLAARELESMDDYVVAKSPVLQRILAAAGLSEGERAAILAANAADGDAIEAGHEGQGPTRL